jgi:hypothetical protein
MTIGTLIIERTGPGAPADIEIALTDTGFDPLSSTSPTAHLVSYVDLVSGSTGADVSFQSFLSTRNDGNNEFDIDTSLAGVISPTVGPQLLSSAGGFDSASLEISNPTGRFSLTQIAHVHLSGPGSVMFDGRTEVMLPEPASVLCWLGVGVACAAGIGFRRRRA